MVQCKKCKLFLSLTKDEVIRCKGPCEAVFHKKCVKKLHQFQRSEKCEICSKSESSPKTEIPKINLDVNNSTAESLLSEVNNKLEIIYSMQKKIEELTDTVDFYAEQYQNMLSFKESAEKKMASLENKNTYLQKINGSLEERLTQLEQKEVEKNIEIIGIEEKDNENTCVIVEKIAEKFHLDKNNIAEIKRVGREKSGENRPRPRPIIVTLRSKPARDEWIKQKKVFLTNNDIFTNNNNTRIYINECLTKQMKQVFWNAKKLLKDKYAYIWVQNLKVLIKKDENTKIRNIRSDADIEKLLLCNENGQSAVDAITKQGTTD